jgi:hypothetical protein
MKIAKYVFGKYVCSRVMYVSLMSAYMKQTHTGMDVVATAPCHDPRDVTPLGKQRCALNTSNTSRENKEKTF